MIHVYGKDDKEELILSKHNHNYTQYSNKPKVSVDVVKMESIPKVTPEIEVRSHPDPVGEPGPIGIPGIADVELVNETVKTKALPTTVEGVVSGCAKLNVRSDASLFADVVCTLDVMSELMIDVNKSTKDWLYICTATGIEGYCMKKFVDARL